jgi:Holliday junction resolvase-like predicted endonuclease
MVYGAPAEAVTLDKQHLISRGALSWLKLLGAPDICFRFDIVEVLYVGKKPTACIIENAFTLPEPYRY